MKDKKFKWLVTTAVAFGTMLIMCTAAYSGTPSGVRGDECDVKNNDVIADMVQQGDAGVDLMYAIYLANQWGSNRRCAKVINIYADNIKLPYPLFIKTRAGSDEKPFVIRGIDPSTKGRKKIVLNAGYMQLPSGVQNWSDPKVENLCAINIWGDSIRLENIEVKGSPVGGICIGGESGLNKDGEDGIRTSTSISLVNVRVSNANGPGIRVDENAGKVAILPDVSISGAKQGVVFENKSYMANVRITGTNRQIDTSAVSPDANGLAVLSNSSFFGPYELIDEAFGITTDTTHYTFIDTPSEENFSFDSITGSENIGTNFIDSAVNASVQLWKIQRETQMVAGVNKTVYRVKGAAVEADPHTSIVDTTAFCNVEQTPRVEDLYRLHIYGVEGGNARFLTYVLETSEGASGLGLGIRTTEFSKGVFEFVIDPNGYGRTITSIIIVPEFKGRPMGAASQIIPLIRDRDMDCPGLAGGVVPGGGGVGGDGGSIMQYPTFYGCLIDQSLSTGFTVDADYDTDGDTIPDWKEMSVRVDDWLEKSLFGSFINKDKSYDVMADRNKAQCSCEGMVSCWYKKDTDGDGVPDGSINGGELLKSDGTVREGKRTVVGVSSGSNLPAARDTDSDGDSVIDGIEDRIRTYQVNAPAYYYDSDSIGTLNQLFINPSTNKAAKCNLNQWETIVEGEVGTNYITTGFTPDTVGVFYGLYLVGPTKGIRAFNKQDIQQDDVVKRLECRNMTTFWETNFNGKYDRDFDRSDLMDPDSNIVDLTVCLPNEIIATIPDPEWREGTRLVDKDANGTPDLFEQKNADGTWNWQLVQSVCSDLDSDGIPDCLKRWDGQCPQQAPIAQLVMNPYSDDFDRDCVPDKIDVCPFTGKEEYSVSDTPAQRATNCGAATKSDGYTSGSTSSPTYSCADPLKAYAEYATKIIACFVDRDKDGLRDCEEDRDVNGIVDKVKGIDGIATTETDPLDENTDDDGITATNTKGLTDYEERTLNVKTNPSDPDTDADGLEDGEEVMGDGNATSVNVKECIKGEADTLTGSMCAADKTTSSARSKYNSDTDPLDPDTDNDGIFDSVEIKTTGTNPICDDSDGDGLTDSQEDTNKNGIWPKFSWKTNERYPKADNVVEQSDYFDTNPCDSNTDKQGLGDYEEIQAGTCPSNPSPSCKLSGENGSGKYGYDTDSDGMPDMIEEQWGTDFNDSDTDDDGLVDGCDDTGELGELCWHVRTGNWQTGLNTAEGESNPGNKDDTTCPTGRGNVVLDENYTSGGAASFCGAQVAVACGSDTDGDGLSDYYEKQFNTSPNNPDTDGDGIIDGIEAQWVVAVETGPGSGLFALSSQRGRETFIVGGSMTNPMDADTDDDGLVDGYNNATNFEDRNCNGRVDVNEKGWPSETDPKTIDSDGDSRPDKEELCHRGVCNNVARAVTGQREGCNVAANGGENETWGMTAMILLTLATTRVAAVVMRRRKKKAVSS